ncbi:MAG: tetratricopeptide repeat protein, partial [Gammaproteobacteria bacterium]
MLALTLLHAASVFAADDARGAAEYERALELLQKRDSQGALIELKNAVQAAPGYLPAWLELGRIYLDFGYGQLAEGAYERASELGADASLTLLPRARSYLIQGKLDELLALTPSGESTPADQAALLVLQGNAQLESGEPEEALQRFKRAERLAPRSAAALWGTSMARLRQGDVREALLYADSAAALAPEQAETWFVRAEVQRQAGEVDAALADFSRAIELQPEHMPARLGRAALLMDAGKLDEAAADLADVRRAQPDDLQAMHLYALLLAAQGKHVESEQVLDDARKRLKQLPERVIAGNLPSLMLSATIALKDDQPATAIAHLERYLARVPNHLGANKLLAAAYLRDAQAGAARALIEPLVSAHPDDAGLVWLLGTA